MEKTGDFCHQAPLRDQSDQAHQAETVTVYVVLTHNIVTEKTYAVKIPASANTDETREDAVAAQLAEANDGSQKYIWEIPGDWQHDELQDEHESEDYDLKHVYGPGDWMHEQLSKTFDPRPLDKRG